jgi:hypothetical protein
VTCRRKIPCEGCGELFVPRRPDQRHHDERCKQRAYRKRRRPESVTQDLTRADNEHRGSRIAVPATAITDSYSLSEREQLIEIGRIIAEQDASAVTRKWAHDAVNQMVSDGRRLDESEQARQLEELKEDVARRLGGLMQEPGTLSPPRRTEHEGDARRPRSRRKQRSRKQPRKDTRDENRND